MTSTAIGTTPFGPTGPNEIDRLFLAKSLGQTIEELEESERLARKAIETYAAVARDRSDKGAIATMAQYLVRDVVELREQLRQELGSRG